MMKNKKAQFYIFTAVILSTYLFALVSATSQKLEESSKFEILKDNFIKVSSTVINSALYSQNNVSEQFNEFSLDFMDYAKTKGIDLELLYILVQDDVEINNYLNKEVKINNYTLNKGQSLIIDKTEQITIESYDIDYDFDISNEPLQLKGILRTEENSNIQVHVIR